VGVGSVLAVLWTAFAFPAAAAVRLSIGDAAAKADGFAKRTCARDEFCIRHGVGNCRRQSPHIVLCRIFDERHTRVQGRYRCTRLIRVSLDPGAGVRVTGVGRWHCPG
jgi:hypothetical protein